MVAAAVVGSAVVGAAASSYSGKKGADAARDAANQSSDTELQMFYQNRDDLAPYRQVGTGALNQLAAMYGIQNTQPRMENVGGTQALSQIQQQPVMSFEQFSQGRSRKNLFMLRRQYDDYVDNANKPPLEASNDSPAQEVAISDAPAASPDFSQFYNSPDYQFAYDQGMRGTEQSLARRGLTGSGAEMKALTRFGQGLASQQLGNYKNSLAALAGIGQTSTSQTAQLGANTAASIGANQRAAGDARASSYLNTGTAVNNAANSYGQYRLLQAGGYLG